MRKRRINRFAEALKWVALPTVMVTGVIVAAMNWPAAVTIEADIVARRISFHTASGAQKLLGATPVRSLSLRGFDTARMPAGSVEVADLRKRNTVDLSWPPDAWQPLSWRAGLELHPLAGREARVFIRQVSAGNRPLTINSLAVAEAEVTLESPEKNVLAVEFSGAGENGSAQLPQEAEMTLEDCDCAGTALKDCGSALTLRLKPPAGDTNLSFASYNRGIYAQLRFAPGDLNLLPNGDFLVARPVFQDTDETGRPVTTLTGDARITFPDYPNTPPLSVPAGHFLRLAPRMQLYIRNISAADDLQSLRIRIGGAIDKLESGPRGSVRDRTPTWFDLQWKKSNLVALFTVIVWLVPVLLGSLKLYHEWIRGER